MKNKERIIAIVCFALFIVFLVFFLVFWALFRSDSSGDSYDASKWQITIVYRLINIRAEVSLDAEILGQVKQGETYDVLGYTVDEEYEWYQIEKDGIKGYVGSKKDAPYVKETGQARKSDIELKYYDEYVVFVDGNITLDGLTCTSSYGCDITYEILDDDYIQYIATDSLGTSVYKTQRYYMVYSISNFEREYDDVTVRGTFSNLSDGLHINLQVWNKILIPPESLSPTFYYIITPYSDVETISTINESVVSLETPNLMFQAGNLLDSTVNAYQDLVSNPYEFSPKQEYLIGGVPANSCINVDYLIPRNVHQYFTEPVKYFEFGYRASLPNAVGFRSYLSEKYVMPY